MGDHHKVWETWLKLGMVYHGEFDFEQASQAFEQAFVLKKSRRQDDEPQIPPEGGSALRIGSPLLDIYTLDPGKIIWASEENIAAPIYSGIARLDEEHNLVPYGAVSWDVLEGGVRYRIHLRDDVSWSDGEPVTSSDYE